MKPLINYVENYVTMKAELYRSLLQRSLPYEMAFVGPYLYMATT